MRLHFRLPDWIIYAVLFGLIYANAKNSTRDTVPPPPAPELGPILPGESPLDPSVVVDIKAPASGLGTAFAIDTNGTWLTARHVVDRCDEVGLHLGGRKMLQVDTRVSRGSDTAILTSKWTRDPLVSDLYSTRRVGEYGYFFGFPQGRPGEVVGTLIGRSRLKVRGRYRTEEPILAWAERGRTRGLKGTLGGLSGGPAFDADGEVIGLVAAESRRRGRVYTVAPRNLQALINETSRPVTASINPQNYGLRADGYRRQRRIAQVMCWVD